MWIGGLSPRRQLAPSAHFVQPDDRHHRGAHDDDRGLNRIGVSHGGKPADDRHDGREDRQDHDDLHDVPAHQVVQDQGAGEQRKRHLGHDADHEHQAGEEQAGRGVVAQFEELGDREHLRADVVGEEHRAGKSQADRRRQLDRPGFEPVAIGVARQAHQMLRSDVGGVQRRTHDGPEERPPGQEEVGAGLGVPLAHCQVQPHQDAAAQDDAADHPIQIRQAQLTESCPQCLLRFIV